MNRRAVFKAGAATVAAAAILPGLADAGEKDRYATAAARIPECDGYLAAIINFRYMANAMWTTEIAVENLGA